MFIAMKKIVLLHCTINQLGFGIYQKLHAQPTNQPCERERACCVILCLAQRTQATRNLCVNATDRELFYYLLRR
jgi:hypothetical protein